MVDKETKVGIFDSEVLQYAPEVEARNSFMDSTIDQSKDLLDQLEEQVLNQIEGEFLGKKKSILDINKIADELVKRIKDTIESKGLVKTGKMRDSVTSRKVK